MKNLILIGPRSVGKTSVGKELAKISNKKYVDFDKVVDKKLKGLDKHIKKFGADSYRKKERKILTDFLKKLKSGTVISVGGGTVASQLHSVSNKNSQDIKKKGIIIYLCPAKNKKQAIKILYKRELKRKGNQKLEWISKSYNLRSPIYNKIKDIKIIVNNKTTKQMAKEILSILKKHKLIK